MQIASYRPHPTARRYDAGTPPVPSIYGGLAGVELIREAGVPAIREHVRGLVEQLVAGLDELGAKVAAPPLGPLVCVRSTDAPALVDVLAAESIVASERDSSLRVSLHLYNTRRGRRHRARGAGAAPATAAVRRRISRPRREESAMSRDLSQNERRLAALARDRGALGGVPDRDRRLSVAARRRRPRRRAPAGDRSPAGRGAGAARPRGLAVAPSSCVSRVRDSRRRARRLHRKAASCADRAGSRTPSSRSRKRSRSSVGSEIAAARP